MCSRHPVQRAASITSAIARFSAPRGREARKPPYPRPAALGACSRACAVLGVHDHQPVEFGDGSRIAATNSAGSRCGNSSTPESARKHLNPNTPASCSGRRSRDVAGNGAAPETDVDEAVLLAPPCV